MNPVLSINILDRAWEQKRWRKSGVKLLAIDIGNTTINFGLFSAKGGSACGRENNKLSKIKVLTAKFQEVPFNCYDNAIITSVVPSATNKIVGKLKVKPRILNSNDIPIKIRVEHPNKVGSDRLVNSVAAKEIYGVPSIVVDLGTATTFDIVSGKGEYIGGIIAPGLNISLDALYEKTAKLPRIKLEIPKNIIGKNTREAMLSGVFFGTIGLIKEVIGKVKSEKFNKPKIILTGGYADCFQHYFQEYIIDKDLTLKGLKIIFEKYS